MAIGCAPLIYTTLSANALYSRSCLILALALKGAFLAEHHMLHPTQFSPFISSELLLVGRW